MPKTRPTISCPPPDTWRCTASPAQARGAAWTAASNKADNVSPFYDPMLGKLIAWGEDREQARLRLLSMLDEFAVGGLKTNLGFLRRIIGHPAFAAAELDTGFIPRYQDGLLPLPGALSDEFWQAAGAAFIQSMPAGDGAMGGYPRLSRGVACRGLAAPELRRAGSMGGADGGIRRRCAASTC